MDYEQGSPPDFRNARRQKAKLIDQTKADRLPPNSQEAEAGVLGCALLSAEDVMPHLIEKLPSPEVFYDRRWRQVYEVLVSMYNDRVPIDLITVQQELKDLCKLEEVGGLAVLSGLPDLVPSAANWDYYAAILLEKFALRKAIATCTEFPSRAYEHQGEVDELIGQLEHDVRSITDGAQNTGTLRKASALVPLSIDWMEQAHVNQGQLSGIATGFADFDAMTGGLQCGEMTVIAARPSVGKSSLCMNVVDHVAVSLNLPTVVFSLEMTAVSLMNRTICSRARVNLTRVRDGQMSQTDLEKLTAAASQLHHAPLYIDDASGTSVMQLRAKARRIHQHHGIRLIVVDYLQLLTSSRKKVENRQQEIADISGGIKNLAKELGVPIVVASQLNREVEKDKKRKPRMSDIRESGAVEQDADIVGFLYRPHIEEAQPENPEAEPVHLLIAKNRNGRTGDIALTFLKGLTRFESAAHADT